jgi:hypothetical protein
MASYTLGEMMTKIFIILWKVRKSTKAAPVILIMSFLPIDELIIKTAISDLN